MFVSEADFDDVPEIKSISKFSMLIICLFIRDINFSLIFMNIWICRSTINCES